MTNNDTAAVDTAAVESQASAGPDVRKALRQVYLAPTAEAAERRFAEFDQVGQDVSRHHLAVALSVGAVHPIPGIPARDPAGRLHHKRNRVAQRPLPPGHPPSRPIPQQAALKVRYLVIPSQRPNRANVTGKAGG